MAVGVAGYQPGKHGRVWRTPCPQLRGDPPRHRHGNCVRAGHGRVSQLPEPAGVFGAIQRTARPGHVTHAPASWCLKARSEMSTQGCMRGPCRARCGEPQPLAVGSRHRASAVLTHSTWREEASSPPFAGRGLGALGGEERQPGTERPGQSQGLRPSPALLPSANPGAPGADGEVPTRCPGRCLWTDPTGQRGGHHRGEGAARLPTGHGALCQVEA